MVRESPRRRVLFWLETHWDRKQLDACAERWRDGFDVEFPPPNDVDCPYDFDPLAVVDAAAAGDYGTIDGVTSSSDYPGATLAAAVATRLGLPGPRPEAVIGASHKYHSRVAQREAAPEAVPDFAAIDPRRDDAEPPLPFPCFVKPVKGAFSILARRFDDPESMREFLASPTVREFGSEYMAIFNRLVAAWTPYEIDGHWFVVEGLLGGDLVTVEGWVCDGAVELLGVVDSTLHANRSFERFDYPSRLPEPVQERMASIARRVIAQLGLDRCLFNIEMVYDAPADRIAIVEVNPRICGQFADLYQKVDGQSSYEIALALCTGGRPERRRGEGPHAAAASFPMRVFEAMRVERAPDARGVAAGEAQVADALVWSECEAGDELSDFGVDEDGGSHRYAVINVGGADRDDLARRRDAVLERLDYRMRPLDGA